MNNIKIKNIEKVAERITRAVKNKERIIATKQAIEANKKEFSKEQIKLIEALYVGKTVTASKLGSNKDVKKK